MRHDGPLTHFISIWNASDLKRIAIAMSGDGGLFLLQQCQYRNHINTVKINLNKSILKQNKMDYLYII